MCAVYELPLQLLPRKVARHIAGPAQIGCRELAAANRPDALSRRVATQVTQELDADREAVDLTPPTPAVLVWVGIELQAFERSLDDAQVSIGLHVRHEQHVDVRGAQVLGNDVFTLGRQNLWDQTTQDNQERHVFAQLIQEPHECGLGSRPGLA